MGEVVPRLSDMRTAGGSRRRKGAPRWVVRDVESEHARGLIIAARVNANAHVARTALANTAQLTRDEELYGQLAPYGAARFRAIVDAFAINAAAEVADL